MKKKRTADAMELMFGVTNEEIIACSDSNCPNDQAFATAMAALVRAWRTGWAERYLPTARAIANGHSGVIGISVMDIEMRNN